MGLIPPKKRTPSLADECLPHWERGSPRLGEPHTRRFSAMSFDPPLCMLVRLNARWCLSYAACAGMDLQKFYVRCACLPMRTRLHLCICVYVCVRACSWKPKLVFKFVRACAWHLAWHVRVTLPVVHVHARMDARKRVCACRACA